MSKRRDDKPPDEPASPRKKGEIRIRSITVRPRPPTAEERAARARLARSLLARGPLAKESPPESS